MNIASIITGIIILILGLDAVAQRVNQIGRKRVLKISYTAMGFAAVVLVLVFLFGDKSYKNFTINWGITILITAFWIVNILPLMFQASKSRSAVLTKLKTKNKSSKSRNKKKRKRK
ncbi:MAG: hypothetical protein U9R23_00915 [Candidatus Cloacimonadota bacterium]|nr:hypothetical protein [Candidatus Cloacimonadota bacterium]